MAPGLGARCESDVQRDPVLVGPAETEMINGLVSVLGLCGNFCGPLQLS